MTPYNQPPDNTEKLALICLMVVVVLPMVVCAIAIAINSILKLL